MASDNQKSEIDYIEVRREWNERYGDYLSQARNWRLVSIISLLLLAGSVAGNVIQGTQSKMVPYVIKVDQIGAPVGAGMLQAYNRPEATVIRYVLAEYITNLKSVYLDGSLLKRNIQKSFGMSTPAAQGYIQGFYNPEDSSSTTNPLNIAQSGKTVEVKIESALPVGDDSWRIQWEEITRTDAGKVEKTETWQAVVGTALEPPTSAQQAMVNPLGLYVTQLTWQKISKK